MVQAAKDAQIIKDLQEEIDELDSWNEELEQERDVALKQAKKVKDELVVQSVYNKVPKAV